MPVLLAGITLAGVVKFVVGIIVVTALSFTIQALTRRRVPGRDFSQRVDNLRTIQRGNTAPARVGYGETVTSGVLAFGASADVEGVERQGGEYLHLCLLISLGPIGGIDSIRLNDIDLNDEVQREQFGDLILFIPQLGNSDQPALGGEFALGSTTVKIPTKDRFGKPLWTDQHRLRGIAYLWSIIQFHPEVFASGAPNITMRWKGRLVWDPRDTFQSYDDPTTWRYSNNWALCCLDFILSAEYGLGIDLADVDVDAVKVEADYCDALVETPLKIYTGGAYTPGEDAVPPDGILIEPSENPPHTFEYFKQLRYTVDGAWETDASRIDIMQALLSAGAGSLTPVNGRFKLRSGRPWDTDSMSPTYDGAYGTLNDDDLRGPFRFLPKVGRRDGVNTMRATFPNHEKNFEPDQIPPVVVEEWKKDDGNLELADELELSFTSDVYRAQRLARFELKKRRKITLECPCKPAKLNVRSGDVLQVTFTTVGWTNKLFEVLDAKILPDQGIDLALREYDADDFDESPDDLAIPAPGPDTELGDPFLVEAVTALAAVASTHVQPDGTRIARIDVTWTAPVDTFVQEYRVHYKRLEDLNDPRQLAIVHSERFELVGVRSGFYQFDVAAVNQVGRIGPTRTTFAVVTVKHLPPPDVALFVFDLRDDQMRTFYWALLEPDPSDLRGFELRVHNGALGSDPVAEWETARTFQNLVRGNYLETRRPTRPATYTFYIRSVDTDGTYSNGVRHLVVTIPPRRQERLIHAEEGSENEWMGGTINDRALAISAGRVNIHNQIEALSRRTWDELTTWDAWTKWQGKPGAFTYVHEIDLGEELDVWPTFEVQVRDAAYVVKVRARSEGATYGPFQFPRVLRNARYVQFHIKVIPPISADVNLAPTLIRFLMVLQDALLEEIVDKLNTASFVGVPTYMDISEVLMADWQQGDHYNTVIEESGSSLGRGTLTLEGDTALELNGSSQYGTVADAPGLRLPGSFTIEMTLRPEVFADTNRSLLRKGDDWGIRYGVHGTGVINFHAVGESGDDPNHADARITLEDGFFPATIAFRYSHELQRWSGFLNGRKVFEMARNFTLAASSAAVRIGASSVPDEHFQGILEEIRVFSYARSDEDVAADVDNVFEVSTPGLVAYWKADDGSGAQLGDRGPNAYHATLTGSPAWVRIAARTSPAMDLSFVQELIRSKIRWTSSIPSGTSLTIEGRLRDDNAEIWLTAWTALTEGDLPFLTLGSDLNDRSLYLRQLLKQTNLAAAAPRLSRIDVKLGTRGSTGDVTHVPRRLFSRIDTVLVTAIQQAAQKVTVNVLSKSKAGVRVQLFDPATAAAKNALIDLLLRGGPAR